MLYVYGDALSNSCTKLGNHYFVSKFAEIIEDSTLILFKKDRSKTLVCELSSLPARYNRLNEQNLSSLKLTPYIFL